MKVWLCLCAAMVTPGLAQAQPALGNPFAQAAQYRQQRGEAAPATLRLRYEVTTTVGAAAPRISETVFEVAPDWSLTTAGGVRTLRDFKLNRLFILRDDGFVSLNSLGQLAFRVLERQNRAALAKTVGDAPSSGKDCDADAETAAIIAPPVAKLDLVTQGAVFSLTCDGRTISAFTRGTGSPPPAALWPTLNDLAPLHPALFRSMRALGTVPERIDNSPGLVAGQSPRISYRLVSSEAINVAYPLADGTPNTTGAVLDKSIGSGLGTLAAQATAGRAQGGPPTAESWTTQLRAVFQKEGRAGVGMLLLPTVNMFPTSFKRCQQGAATPFCEAAAVGNAAVEQDAATQMMLAIALADPGGNPNSTSAGVMDQVIAAMRVAQATPQRDHPALGAAYALVAMRFDSKTWEQAKAAGLPTDLAAMQAAAVQAMPYNPAYWLDLGDRFMIDFDLTIATLLYETGLSLPMPEAQAENPAVLAKRTFFERIRADFPDAGLGATP